MDSDRIWIVTSESVDTSDSTATSKGWGEEVQQQVKQFRDKQLDAAELERKMSRFLQTVGRLFRQAEAQTQPQQPGQAQMKLEEIELSIEISGEGEIKLVAGGKAAGKGAIKLKFKRSE
ncbi:MAG: hypothetical protein RLZZ511_3 [Cyanobacteriota bacterium]|jgi:hypothetical protein